MSDASSPGKRDGGGLFRALAPLLYLALFAAGGFTVMTTLDDLEARRASLASARDQLARLRAARGGDTSQEMPRHGLAAGAAFLAGDKQPLAAAELQRRVGASIEAAGGKVLSSQYEKSESTGRTVGVDLTVECEVDQTGLRALLYDLESTTPFVFIDKLNTRVRGETSAAEADPRLRVSMRLAAVWLNREP